jgi:hypothetical protein
MVLGNLKGYPDIIIDEPRGQYHGLRIELKKTGERVKKRNGEWASEHIGEQAEILEKLRSKGYMAEFAVGFDKAKEIIETYMKLPINY